MLPTTKNAFFLFPAGILTEEKNGEAPPFKFVVLLK